MGCTASDETKTDTIINKQYQADARIDDEEKKLLLLGTGASGKSTIFKNLRKSKGDTICDGRTVEETANTLRSNLVTYMVKLLLKSQQLYEMDPEMNKGCHIPDDPKMLEHARLVFKHGQQAFADDLIMLGSDTEPLGVAIEYLWKVPAVQETYKRRGIAFSFPDNLEYFYNNCRTVMSPDYTPSDEDVIRARVRTTGITTYTYTHEKSTYHITDVGGQRSERRKWIHQFEGVAAVLFITALNHYNAVLFEDEKKNAMHEAVDLFVELTNSRYFRQSELILFLNKYDLFKESLKLAPLSVCFTTAAGWDGPEQWTGPDYVKITDDEEKDNENFNLCYEEGLKFIENVFVHRNEVETRSVFCHITMATDESNVKEVFWDVQNIVIRSNLKRGGLII